MILNRRALLASLGLILPVAAAEAATTLHAAKKKKPATRLHPVRTPATHGIHRKPRVTPAA